MRWLNTLLSVRFDLLFGGVGGGGVGGGGGGRLHHQRTLKGRRLRRTELGAFSVPEREPCARSVTLNAADPYTSAANMRRSRWKNGKKNFERRRSVAFHASVGD